MMYVVDFPDTLLCIAFCIEQQEEAIGSRNTAEEKEAQKRVAAEKSKECGFVEKGVWVVSIMIYTEWVKKVFVGSSEMVWNCEIKFYTFCSSMPNKTWSNSSIVKLQCY